MPEIAPQKLINLLSGASQVAAQSVHGLERAGSDIDMAEDNQLIILTADIVSAHVSNNSVAVGDVANLVQRVHEALAGLGAAPVEQALQKKEAVVSIRASVKPDYLICMECGKRQKTLKRHLQTAHGMTPQQYRQDYGLPNTYPMVAAEYASMRRDMAKSIGLGRKKAQAPAEATKRRQRAAKTNPEADSVG